MEPGTRDRSARAWEGSSSSEEHEMNKQQLPLYALALAVLVVGLVVAGVPVGALAVVALLLACPLMMFFMMRGMSHDDRPRDNPTSHADRDG